MTFRPRKFVGTNSSELRESLLYAVLLLYCKPPDPRLLNRRVPQRALPLLIRANAAVRQPAIMRSRLPPRPGGGRRPARRGGGRRGAAWLAGCWPDVAAGPGAEAPY
jgi:hypothetical protein